MTNSLSTTCNTQLPPISLEFIQALIFFSSGGGGGYTGQTQILVITLVWKNSPLKQAENWVKVKNSSPKSLLAYCRYTVGQLSAGSIPTVNRQLTNSKPTLKNLTSVMTSQSLDPYRSIRISRMMYHKLS